MSNISIFNSSSAFLPFGVILFSLIGWSAIPEMADFLKLCRKPQCLKWAIVLATVIVVPFYLIFAVTVIGVAGSNTNSDALSSLLPFLGQKIMVFGILAALITLADSYLVLGLHLRNTFIYDLKIPKNLANLITCISPLILFLIGFRSFIEILGFVGTVVGVIEGIVIILIFKKAKKRGDQKPAYSLKVPSLLLYFLIAVLLLGALSQFLI